MLRIPDGAGKSGRTAIGRLSPMSEPAPRRPRGRPSRQDGPVAPNDDLLPLALEAFADLGYEGSSMRDLCRRLGVSHNLLHQRFGSKDGLWHAAVDHGFRALASDLVVESEASEYDDDLERLRFLMIRWLEITAGSPALAKIINQEATPDGPRHAGPRQLRRLTVGDHLDLPGPVLEP
jgi:AcrR family transcriptional regulator